MFENNIPTLKPLNGCDELRDFMVQHFGRYFGMLITKAKFGDITDFEVIEDYTQNRRKVNNQR